MEVIPQAADMVPVGVAEENDIDIKTSLRITL